MPTDGGRHRRRYREGAVALLLLAVAGCVGGGEPSRAHQASVQDQIAQLPAEQKATLAEQLIALGYAEDTARHDDAALAGAAARYRRALAPGEPDLLPRLPPLRAAIALHPAGSDQAVDSSSPDDPPANRAPSGVPPRPEAKPRLSQSDLLPANAPAPVTVQPPPAAADHGAADERVAVLSLPRPPVLPDPTVRTPGVYAVQSIACEPPFEARVTLLLGDPLPGGGIRVRDRLAVWFDRKRDGISDDGWFCAAPRRYCYGPVGLTDWQADERAGDVFTTSSGMMSVDSSERSIVELSRRAIDATSPIDG